MKVGFILKGIVVPGVINIQFGIFSIPITMLWIVGIVNAINLIDGLDGLAAGIVGIASLFIFIFGLVLKDIFSIYISLTLTGASFAFLKYNFYPAKIFMGDTGSLFLGLVIACLGIYQPPSHLTNPYFIPVSILLFLPILDTNFAIIRRILRKQSIFSGDSSHIHHYFIKRGFNQIQTVIGFYVMTFILGAISLSVLFFISRP